MKEEERGKIRILNKIEETILSHVQYERQENSASWRFSASRNHKQKDFPIKINPMLGSLMAEIST